MFNRTEITQHHPWLTQRKRRMIIGNDIDALLSAQFLHHALGWSIAGFYNYTTLYHDPAIEPRECVWVDLDIYDPACCSIGHHIHFDETVASKGFNIGIIAALFMAVPILLTNRLTAGESDQ
jgi:hypothetical protein